MQENEKSQELEKKQISLGCTMPDIGGGVVHEGQARDHGARGGPQRSVYLDWGSITFLTTGPPTPFVID